MMDALTCITTRRTAPLIEGPEPNAVALNTILQAATLAPDHKFLRPWRFVVVRGPERSALGEALAQAALATDPTLSEDALNKQKNKPLRSPLLIALIASPKAKLPVWEQHASLAAAAQNICLTAHALGLASAWKSSSFGNSPYVRTLFAMQDHEDFFGWIELGHPSPDLKLRERPAVALSDVVTELKKGQLQAFDK